MSHKKTECIYCGSRSYGTGCLFSPTKVHVHTGDPTVCIYCGSKSVGSGCLFNPYSKIHVRGPEFLNRISEQFENAVLLNYVFNKLKNIVVSEQNTVLGNFYKKLVTIISNFSQPILESLSILEKPTYKNIDKQQLTTAINTKKALIGKMNEIKDILAEANFSLPTEIVEEIIIDAIISSK